MTGKILKSAGGTLVDLLMGGARGAARNIPPEMQSSIAIARNALSNIPEIPSNAADALGLGPFGGRIARETYGGSGVTNRGGLLGEAVFNTPPAPRTGFRPSSSADIIRSQAPVRTQAPRPEFDVTGSSPRGFTGSSPGEIISGTPNRPVPQATVNPQAAVNPQPSINVRPTGTMTNSVQGRLDLRNPAGSVANQASTTSKGVQKAPGRKTGGQMYNPQAAATPEASQIIRRGGRDGGPFMDRADSPSYLNRIPAGQLSIPSAIRRTVDNSNAAAGLVDETFQVPAALRGVLPTNEGAFLTNLSDPRVLAALSAGGVGTAFGINALTQGQADRVQGELPMTRGADNVPASVAPPNTLSQVAPVDTAAGQMTAADLVALERAGKGILTGDTAAAAALQAEMETPSVTNPFSSGESVIRTNEGADSIRRQNNGQYGGLDATIDKYTEPMSPEKYANIGDYYRDRNNYANQTSRKNLLAAAIAELSGLQESANKTWALANPGLAYELQRQSLSAPQASEQTPNAESFTAVSELGSNPQEAAATGAAFIGNPDINRATQPQVRINLENLPLSIQQKLAAQGIYQ